MIQAISSPSEPSPGAPMWRRCHSSSKSGSKAHRGEASVAGVTTTCWRKRATVDTAPAMDRRNQTGSSGRSKSVSDPPLGASHGSRSMRHIIVSVPLMPRSTLRLLLGHGATVRPAATGARAGQEDRPTPSITRRPRPVRRRCGRLCPVRADEPRAPDRVAVVVPPRPTTTRRPASPQPSLLVQPYDVEEKWALTGTPRASRR